uniref:Uncharacterized protein n=1 Tax=Romanomermis culicivorax TaxID=13658 RepID=A0A915ITG2_ROMCU
MLSKLLNSVESMVTDDECSSVIPAFSATGEAALDCEDVLDTGATVAQTFLAEPFDLISDVEICFTLDEDIDLEVEINCESREMV